MHTYTDSVKRLFLGHISLVDVANSLASSIRYGRQSRILTVFVNVEAISLFLESKVQQRAVTRAVMCKAGVEHHYKSRHAKMI